MKGCGLIFWVTLQEKRKEVLECSKRPEVASFHCDYLVLRVTLAKVILKQSSVFPCWGMCLSWRDLWEIQSNEKTLILRRVWKKDCQAVFTCYIAERSHDICSTSWDNLQSWFNLPWRLGWPLAALTICGFKLLSSVASVLEWQWLSIVPKS